MNEQINLFDLMSDDLLSINKPIRMIELFAGYGSQSMAFKRLSIPIEHHFVCEFDKFAMQSYNAVHGTDFPMSNICNVRSTDLKIRNTDKYCYFMTYSFPCTDLSVAGKMQGMSKGSGTRSGLLWEVERLLQEIVDSNGELPQVLFMENVKQVISKSVSKKTGRCNFDDFKDWLDFLESIGYVNFYQVLNAKNYGVAQNRERCFMFSFLKAEFGESPKFEFPKPMQLNKVVKDYLEPDVDEKYYIKTEKAEKLIIQLIENGTIVKLIGGGQIVTDGTICEPSERCIANCILAKYDSGISRWRSKGAVVAECERIGLHK